MSMSRSLPTRHVPTRRARRVASAVGLVVLMIAATACFSLDPKPGSGNGMASITDVRSACLLYTSDAADERSSVDLGGRRIIKTKTEEPQSLTQSIDQRTRE